MTASKAQIRKENLLNEVVNLEKQLTASIQSKGILHSDVKELYYKVCSVYERIFVDDHEQLELQDVEYSLWKLHYKHIDEFRKRIKRSSGNNAENPKLVKTQNANDPHRINSKHIAEFQLFLSEAVQFYEKLIMKVRESYRLQQEGLLYRAFGVSKTMEPKKKRKCQILCHRLLVCLGDLARYMEQYENPNNHSHNWLAAATHYLEATMVWPHSGNPQNQLAVLATYVDDEFLALYHCVRSSAAKEPFPDAWDNLILLFERNRSSLLHSLSKDLQFNFLRPSEKCRFEINSRIGSDHDALERDLFPLLIRTLGFFFIKSSLEEFTCTFSSMMRRLDELMSLDDSELSVLLESYKLLGSVRTGPFRAIQIVSVFIFMLHDLFGKTDLNDMLQLELTHLALFATFIVMGRLVERCLTARQLDSFPLLPAVLVFVEWLVNVQDEVERCSCEEKSKSSISYFIGVFVDLLERLCVNTVKAESSLTIPLWEDYELRGFTPVASSHETLDFSSHWEHIDSFGFGGKHRSYRILVAATKISKISNGSSKWIISEPNEVPVKKALESAMSEIPDLDLEEPTQDVCGDVPDEVQNQNHVNKKHVAVEDEEVILFKPLMRHNSAPIYASIAEKEEVSAKDEDQSISSDECLRRATSLLIAQNPGQSGPYGFNTDITNFRRNEPFERHDTYVKETGGYQNPEASISAGPPSLSAWVLNRGGFSNDREKGANDFTKHGLEPIEELAPMFTKSLRLGETESSSAANPSIETGNSYSFSPPYSAPAPSAPLLPDDAAWFTGVHNSKTNGNGYANWPAAHEPPEYSPSITGFSNMYTPSHRMTSSEWLRQYRENHNLEWDRSQACAAPYNVSGNLVNLHKSEVSRYGHLYQMGSPLAPNPTTHIESPLRYPAYGVEEDRKEMLFPGYQRPYLYGCGTATDIRSEQPPLMQYLKGKEWQLQKDAPSRSATYTGN